MSRGGGEYMEDATPSRKSVQWVYQDLTGDYSSFKLFADDPTSDMHQEPSAQLILASMVRNVRLADGKLQNVRIPDAVMTVAASENPQLISVLSDVTRQYGSLFS